MSNNLLLLYEIKSKASMVKSKKAFREFERWVQNLMQTYHDAAVDQVAKICLFRLQEQFSY